ncbi:hypothetical protein GCM10010912_18150 [Paenibacillus albidus]|uniref:HTH cro/C1-type domain-containing protein n=1 Tax=Paenibacillus albidus TaxID=2041023 RepID=A0A917C749_9BACL|nr:helix-turn-helix transcriptional regulator [Paenibacillus albidus]GGF73305.1 hypothetical protein GCM10010912_18150 [Paenibacillus albidus]
MKGTLTKKREKLKKRRLEEGLTQVGLANKVGVSIEQIRSLEYGRVNPSFKVMMSLCAVLKCKPEEIF